MISPVKIWRRQKDIKKILGRQGRIVTWTKISIPTAPFKDQAPFIVALVELDNKHRVFGQFISYKDGQLKINQRVVATLRRVREAKNQGVIPYGVKFKPVSHST